MTNAIEKFTGKNSFLSNFHPSPVEFEGLIYPTAEHAFQAAKSHDPETRKRIRDRPKPGQAKWLGKRIDLRPDWETVKVEIMRKILRIKFAPGTELAERLIATGNAPLIEGNHWNDRFWGVCKGAGKNHLGKILEQIRAEIS